MPTLGEARAPCGPRLPPCPHPEGAKGAETEEVDASCNPAQSNAHASRRRSVSFTGCCWLLPVFLTLLYGVAALKSFSSNDQHPPGGRDLASVGQWGPCQRPLRLLLLFTARRGRGSPDAAGFGLGRHAEVNPWAGPTSSMAGAAPPLPHPGPSITPCPSTSPFHRAPHGAGGTVMVRGVLLGEVCSVLLSLPCQQCPSVCPP